MSPNLFRIIDQEKTLKVNTIWLLARCAVAGNYSIEILLPGSQQMTLTRLTQYGGLHFCQKNVSVRIAPTNSPIKWQLKMTGLGGNEVEDFILVLGYEWEAP